MPVSSFMDYKERIMGGGVNSIARKKGSRNNIDNWGTYDDDSPTEDTGNAD